MSRVCLPIYKMMGEKKKKKIYMPAYTYIIYRKNKIYFQYRSLTYYTGWFIIIKAEAKAK